MATKENEKMMLWKVDDRALLLFRFSFDFCVADESESPVENLGQVLFGERIRPSPYKISFREDKQCTALCQKSYKDGQMGNSQKIKQLQKGMMLNYQHHWSAY